jgi:hypothetical protein
MVRGQDCAANRGWLDGGWDEWTPSCNPAVTVPHHEFQPHVKPTIQLMGCCVAHRQHCKADAESERAAEAALPLSWSAVQQETQCVTTPQWVFPTRPMCAECVAGMRLRPAHPSRVSCNIHWIAATHHHSALTRGGGGGGGRRQKRAFRVPHDAAADTEGGGEPV